MIKDKIRISDLILNLKDKYQDKKNNLKPLFQFKRNTINFWSTETNTINLKSKSKV